MDTYYKLISLQLIFLHQEFLFIAKIYFLPPPLTDFMQENDWSIFHYVSGGSIVENLFKKLGLKKSVMCDFNIANKKF